MGSVIYTSKANYFIAISAGELLLGNEMFYAISSSTPIAKLLLGKSSGDQIHFRDQDFKIIKVI